VRRGGIVAGAGQLIQVKSLPPRCQRDRKRIKFPAPIALILLDVSSFAGRYPALRQVVEAETREFKHVATAA
jgi:hypothetical protein